MLAAAARFGPYFTWEPREPRDDDPRWRPLTDLLDDDVAAERVEAARQTLIRMFRLRPEDVPERVVASITFLGLASRLVSPPLAVAATTGMLPSTRELWWRPVESGPVPMACGDYVAAKGDFRDEIVNGLVEPLLTVFRRRFKLSGHVLWGNVASALGGAVGMIAKGGGPTAEAESVVASALARPPLRGMATLRPPGQGSFLVRRNCCLYYRLPGGGTCGDCVLNRRDRPECA